MKKLSLILIVLLSVFFNACQKGEVPGNDQKFIGVWKNVDGSPGDTYMLTIGSDGKASYEENSTNGITYSNKTISGYIYFSDDYNFRVGSKHIGKKFKVDLGPKRVTVTVTPYVYYYIATFNGVNYKKQM